MTFVMCGAEHPDEDVDSVLPGLSSAWCLSCKIMSKIAKKEPRNAHYFLEFLPPRRVACHVVSLAAELRQGECRILIQVLQ